jgi:hypothetical protein
MAILGRSVDLVPMEGLKLAVREEARHSECRAVPPNLLNAG